MKSFFYNYNYHLELLHTFQTVQAGKVQPLDEFNNLYISSIFLLGVPSPLVLFPAPAHCTCRIRFHFPKLHFEQQNLCSFLQLNLQRECACGNWPWSTSTNHWHVLIQKSFYHAFWKMHLENDSWICFCVMYLISILVRSWVSTHIFNSLNFPGSKALIADFAQFRKVHGYDSNSTERYCNLDQGCRRWPRSEQFCISIFSPRTWALPWSRICSC